MNTEMRILSVHIEKTAGTSLIDYWATQLFKPDSVYVYKPLSNTFICYADMKNTSGGSLKHALRRMLIHTPVYPIIHRYVVNKEKMIENVPSDMIGSRQYRVLHGHFSINQFKNMFVSHFSTIVIREPLQRTISHFQHWKDAKGTMNQREQIPYDPRMTFRDFAFLDSVINWQTRALENKSLSSFNLVGVTERMENFQRQLDILFGSSTNRKTGSLKHLNRSVYDTRNLHITSEFKREFQQKYSPDVDLYAEACAYVQKYSQ